jgi:mannosyltransferase OCH1-like enzyme
MIPKIVHIIVDPPEREKWRDVWKHCVDSVYRYCDDYEIMMWDNQKIDDYLKQNNEDYYIELFKNLPPVCRYDIFRYMALRDIGGCYFDADFELRRKVNDVIQNYSLVLPLEPPACKNQIGNAILFSVPNHPWWDYVFNDFAQRTDWSITSIWDVFNKTSPAFLTRLFQERGLEMMNNCSIDEGKIWFAPTQYFHADHENVFVEHGGYYGRHWCSGAWK